MIIKPPKYDKFPYDYNEKINLKCEVCGSGGGRWYATSWLQLLHHYKSLHKNFKILDRYPLDWLRVIKKSEQPPKLTVRSSKKRKAVNFEKQLKAGKIKRISVEEYKSTLIQEQKQVG